MSRTPLNAFCALTMGQSPDSESYNIEHNGFPFTQETQTLVVSIQWFVFGVARRRNLRRQATY